MALMGVYMALARRDLEHPETAFFGKWIVDYYHHCTNLFYSIFIYFPLFPSMLVKKTQKLSYGS